MNFDLIYIAFFAGVLTLSAAWFLIGRYSGLRSRSDAEETLESLERANDAAKEQLDTQIKTSSDYLIRKEEAIRRWEEIKEEHENLANMKQELDDFVDQESNRIDKLERRRAELAARLRELEALKDKYPPEFFGPKKEWKELIKNKKKKFDDLEQEIVTSNQKLAETNADLEKKKIELAELENIQEKIDIAKQNLENVQEEVRKAEETLKIQEGLVEKVGEAKIQFPSDPLEVAIKSSASSEEKSDKLSAFKILPKCLKGFDDPFDATDEEFLLTEFENTLNQLGMEYPRRIIHAFHTALKVNDLSPLTVLSGLSGTGKSQLPRVYARYFGMHFLHVPVEPGWDSPQDILGFYDFVAERYRPTDRARALGYFDIEFAKEVIMDESDKDKEWPWGDRLLIILLDEMNLARTEYYFSEFLSRLEMRGPRNNSSLDELVDAQIAIDLPYAEGETPKHLYVPHNVLWIGTLNEDETTQTLSDKVLDRANSIRFAPPKPKTLVDHGTAPNENIQIADGYLPYSSWLDWSNKKKSNVEIDSVLEKLAGLMQRSGRGFGYRITQSIKAYVDRYPGQGWQDPMIDQINMRLLPKLAGTELSQCEESLSDLNELCKEDLGHEDFADALEEAIRQSEMSQIFTWPGYTYE